VNTRGHGTFSSIKKITDGQIEWKDIGSARELFDESPLDIEAWVEFLRKKNSNNIFLQGHSLGCNKIVYHYDSYDHPNDIKGLILLSPSDWIGYQVVYYAERYEEDKKLAREMVMSGKGDELMPLDCFVYPITARAYDVNLGHGTKTDMFNYFDDNFDFKIINSIPIPLLVTFGNDNEVVVRDPGECIEMLRCHSISPKFEGHVIVGSPHNYYRFEVKLASIIDKWIKKVLSATS
jgi:pimeloyl-ACP methyl ester carboxylesterase